ncbi:FAD-dependent monooxygenase [Nonomuraea thailandensis]
MAFFGIGYDAAERLGILAELRQRNLDPFQLRYVKADGTHHFSVPSSAIRDLIGPRQLTLLRGDLEEVLHHAVRDHADIRHGTTVESVTQTEDTVAAHLSDGTVVEADLLVGADGLHSQVRRLVFGPEEEFRVDLNHIVTAFTLDRHPAQIPPQTSTTLTTIGHTVTVTSLGPHRTAAFLVHRTTTPAADLAKGPAVAVDDAFADLAWILPDLRAHLRQAGSAYFDSVSQIVLDRWSIGRVVLVGDAAWCVTLFGGYGASLAVGGADLLASALDHPATDISTALRAWESRLRPTVLRRQQIGRRNTAAHAPANRLRLATRNLVMRLAALPPTRHLLRRHLDLHPDD